MFDKGTMEFGKHSESMKEGETNLTAYEEDVQKKLILPPFDLPTAESRSDITTVLQ
jgi:hypothetical protein